MKVRLGKTWEVGPLYLMARGGFGRVHAATGEHGEDAVAKFVPKEPGADRELLFGDSVAASRFRNVVPVLDSGEHGGDFVLIMPRASKTLRQHLASAGRPLRVEEAIPILSDIATALVDLDSQIVHRDLKPENVLLLEGRWCLTDFGISRYAAATTGADTRKFSLTEQYAAPEQWRMEHATGAVDVYAFGVIAYEMLAGQRPFGGPDFRSQHLFETPAALTSGAPRLRTLIEECLWKPPDLRPTPAALLARVEHAGAHPATSGATKLARANQGEADRITSDQAEAAKTENQAERRAAFARVAEQSFEALVYPLLTAVQSDAPLAQIERNAGHGTMHFVARLRAGKLGLSKVKPVEPWEGPFTVIAEAVITVNMERDGRGYEGRSHSLWYGDLQEVGRFAWYELAFMESPLVGASSPVAPFSGDPRSMAIAFSNVTGTKQLAWPVEEIDRSDPTEFVDRWIGWFADAATRELYHPSIMPEKPTDGSW